MRQSVVISTLLTVLLLVGLRPVTSAPALIAPRSIVGSWMAIPTVAGRSAEPHLLTFTSDGTVIRSTGLGGRSAGHGAWVSTGEHTVTYTLIVLRYNAGFDFAGTTRDRIDLTLNATSDGFTGSGKFTLFDAQGTMGRSVDVTFHGTRIKAESP